MAVVIPIIMVAMEVEATIVALTSVAMAATGVSEKINEAAADVFGEDLVKVANIAGSIYMAGAGAMGGGVDGAASAVQGVADGAEAVDIASQWAANDPVAMGINAANEGANAIDIGSEWAANGVDQAPPLDGTGTKPLGPDQGSTIADKVDAPTRYDTPVDPQANDPALGKIAEQAEPGSPTSNPQADPQADPQAQQHKPLKSVFASEADPAAAGDQGYTTKGSRDDFQRFEKAQDARPGSEKPTKSLLDQFRELDPKTQAALIHGGGKLLAGAGMGYARGREIEDAKRQRELYGSGSGIVIRRRRPTVFGG